MLLHTIRDPWKKVRTAVSAADDCMTAAGAGGTPKKNWSARDITKGCVIPIAANGIGLAIMGSVEDATVTVNLYQYAQYGPAEFIGAGTFTIGAMEVVEDPTDPSLTPSSLLYADTFVWTDREWPADKVGLIDAGGDDGICEVLWEAWNAYFLKVEIAAISAGTATPIFKYG